MHLKSLTLKGFKSFAQPTTFQFEPGVTCIVGPNGSGKSNVVDALAWVMGEQGAKTLRGGTMADVIFAGTATRGPLGRAEVQLTIDNSDGMLPIEYAEVTISRTLFRNGGSEYAINGTACRLLDVQELLSDSGLGREMHVIVGQGQLDAVLHASPEDRRGFIEEAAGILKHRRRKEKTVRKLEAMQSNLTRLSDLAGRDSPPAHSAGPPGRDRARGADHRGDRARCPRPPARRRGRHPAAAACSSISAARPSARASASSCRSSSIRPACASSASRRRWWAMRSISARARRLRSRAGAGSPPLPQLADPAEAHPAQPAGGAAGNAVHRHPGADRRGALGGRGTGHRCGRGRTCRGGGGGAHGDGPRSTRLPRRGDRRAVGARLPARPGTRGARESSRGRTLDARGRARRVAAAGERPRPQRPRASSRPAPTSRLCPSSRPPMRPMPHSTTPSPLPTRACENGATASTASEINCTALSESVTPSRHA